MQWEHCGKERFAEYPFRFPKHGTQLDRMGSGIHLSSVFRGKYRGKEGMGREKEKKFYGL